MNIVKKSLVWKASSIVFFSTIAWSLSASGECVPVNGWNNKSFNIAIPAMVIPRDTPIGTVVFSRSILFPNQVIAYCDPGTYWFYTKFRNGWIPDSTGIAPTNVPGIGVRIKTIPETTPYSGPYFYGPESSAVGWYGVRAVTPGTAMSFNSSQGFTFQLIKQGPTSSGTLRTGIYAGVSMNNAWWPTAINITSSGSFSTPACEVTNTSIIVPLGNIKQREFSGIGSTPASKTFNITLDCHAPTNIKMTLTATAESSGAPGVIAVNSSSGDTVANGIGIQLLYDNNPVIIGTPITIGTYQTGSNQIGMVARYYQTKSLITAGDANGVATFTFTYN